MKKTFKLAISLLFVFLVSVQANGSFPKTPNLNETPGKLCSNSVTVRYPEGIKYCERNVDSYTKNAVITNYDQLFGYNIKTMNRGDFKIDHLIPLCAGGANSPENLWPQHKSIYEITDPIEPLLCEKMKEGKLLQADAVKLIIEAKTHLDQVPAVMRQLNSL